MASAMNVVKNDIENRNFRGIAFSSAVGGVERAADRTSRASIALRFGDTTEKHTTKN
jgi:hypothetical protein